MIPKIEHRGPAVSDERLREFEALLGERLPDAYRSFLAETNGGVPDPESCCTDAPWGGTSIDFFCSLDLPYPRCLYPEWVEGHPGLLMIARDQGGNKICLALDAARRGQVFFWAHDEPEGANNAWKIADDFDDFLQSFTDEDDS